MNDEITARLVNELQQLANQPTVKLFVSPFTALQIICQLQLALRHPVNTEGNHAQQTRDFIEALVNTVPFPDSIKDLISMGWNPEHDRVVEPKVETHVTDQDFEAALISEEITSTYQADLNWDYYKIWLNLTTLNNKIIEVLKLISGKEKADEIDKQLQKILEPHTDVLSNIVDGLTSTYQADPNWDYYEIWLNLTILNNKIIEGLKLISGKEKANDEIDKQLQKILEPHTDVLSNIVDDLNWKLE